MRSTNNYIPPEIMALRNKSIQTKTDIIHNTIRPVYVSANQNIPLVRPKIQPNLEPKVQLTVQPRVYINNPAISRSRYMSYVNHLNIPQRIVPGEYVTVRLMGGIGNRIFQILAALGYSDKFEKK